MAEVLRDLLRSLDERNAVSVLRLIVYARVCEVAEVSIYNNDLFLLMKVT